MLPSYGSRSQAWRRDEASMCVHIARSSNARSQLCEWAKCSFSHLILLVCLLYSARHFTRLHYAERKIIPAPGMRLFFFFFFGSQRWKRFISFSGFQHFSCLKQPPSSAPRSVTTTSRPEFCQRRHTESALQCATNSDLVSFSLFSVSCIKE